ncbi:hypothetical protein [uncultured Demequina sp.]|uniref:hypothetical protein n=1 Tax=uncultured Demequina sp. TaxID=693499 RepID=UPI0025D31F03|nr:hypothetical protein [uncultured Demequina sp.]
MKALRVVGSAFLVLLGTMLIVAWGLSVKSVRSIEEGTATDALVTSVLESPETAALVADQVQAAIREQVDQEIVLAGLDLFDQQIHDVLVSAIGSEFVTGTVSTGVDRLSNRLLEEIADADREPAAFALSVDIGARVDARIDEIPVVGPLVPDLDLPAYEVEVIDAQTFEDVRAAYAALGFAATWFVWWGLVLIVGGIALAPTWRWFAPRALVGAGVIGLGIAFALGSMGPPTIASFMPGGRDGGAGVLVEDVIATTALGPIVDVLMTLGLVALVLAAVFWLVLRYLWRDPALASEAEPAADEETADAAGPEYEEFDAEDEPVR